MIKIANVIDNCTDCPHFVQAQTKCSNNKTNVAICGFPTKNEEPFLLFYSEHGTILDYAMNIPENCPLEDYTGTQTIAE